MDREGKRVLYSVTKVIYVSRSTIRHGIKRWRLYILPRYHGNLTQLIEYSESHIFAIFVLVLTLTTQRCSLGLKMSEFFFLLRFYRSNVHARAENYGKCTSRHHFSCVELISQRENQCDILNTTLDTQPNPETNPTMRIRTSIKNLILSLGFTSYFFTYVVSRTNGTSIVLWN